jgi:hypothetical protein
MQFTRHEESLFLLDEPDTHLNPVWKLRYLRELARQCGLLAADGEVADDEPGWLDSTSQLILTTHDPLTIAGLRSDQVQIFKRVGNSTISEQPDEDPRGMGVAGVLLRMFGLPTTLDLVTQEKINRRNDLLYRADRDESEEEQLRQLSRELDELGLAYESRDPQYREYLRALHNWEQAQETRLAALPNDEQEELVGRILDQLMESRR